MLESKMIYVIIECWRSSKEHCVAFLKHTIYGSMMFGSYNWSVAKSEFFKLNNCPSKIQILGLDTLLHHYVKQHLMCQNTEEEYKENYLYTEDNNCKALNLF